ncbi:MAG: hypothetical protein UR68_C0033G0012 [Candidatus Roizmanbacteria bacterium GW2011_GWA2_35_19]|uniref:HAD family hydrolase n=1 Tax=Candidatus Roizmanbacteria bacterium GW2011_GWA2_35_19 TaxID=1618478 RepID=A0A0G0E873_9BACT|nr:MAG: hypothetical protein UR68_C0033G0012 [Candidatus Roizmanbacteria bacterium GW2011_GWA2_35_19]
MRAGKFPMKQFSIPLGKYLENNPKKYLIFDLDETLFRIIWPEDTAFIIKKYLKIIDPNFLNKNVWGYEYYNQLIKKLGQKVKKKLNAIYIEFELRLLNNLTDVNLELIDFIKSNQQNYTFYIWSNNQRKTIESILKKFNCANYFKEIVSATDVSLFKPDTEGFYRLYEANQNKKEYLMIGDSENDKKAAKNSGIDYLYLHI